jgi:hypothetical protein
MRDNTRFEQALVAQVDRLFEEDRTVTCKNVGTLDWKRVVLSAPFVRLHYAMFDDGLIEELKILVRAALAKKMQFHLTKPSWAPDLPLSLDEGRKLKRKRDKRVQLVGYYGISQLMARYDEAHPYFDPFCCGLMADESTPEDLRSNFDLQRMYPPKRIMGLAKGEGGFARIAQGGYWCTDATLMSWCDLMARIGASVLHVNNPEHQEQVAVQLYQEAIAPEIERMFR